MKYRIAKGWQLIYYIFGGGIILLGLLMTKKGLTTEMQKATFITFFGVLFALFGLALIINTARTLVEVDEMQVTVTNLFGPRSLALDKIRGYGSGEKKQFYLFPVGEEKILTIPPNLAKRDQLISYFKLKYSDVNAVLMKEATTRLLEDERFGATKEERAVRLKRTAWLAIVLNFFPVLLLLLLSFVHRYYEIIIWVIFSIPWILALITRSMKGMIALLPKRNNPAPSFFLALAFTAMAAVAGTMPRFDFYDPGGKELALFIVTGLVAMKVYGAICGDIFATSEKKPLAYLIFGVLFIVYSAMLILFSNCWYDRGAARYFEAEIRDKHISHGKGDTYYLTLSPWGKFQDEKDFSVSSHLYTITGRGDSIRVSLFPGKWQIPWYRLNRADLPAAGTPITQAEK